MMAEKLAGTAPPSRFVQYLGSANHRQRSILHAARTSGTAYRTAPVMCCRLRGGGTQGQTVKIESTSPLH
jgi:hypothetical protein